MVRSSRRSFFSTEAEEAQDSEHDDDGTDDPNKLVHVKSPSKWNEPSCKQVMRRGSSGSNFALPCASPRNDAPRSQARHAALGPRADRPVRAKISGGLIAVSKRRRSACRFDGAAKTATPRIDARENWRNWIYKWRRAGSSLRAGVGKLMISFRSPGGSPLNGPAPYVAREPRRDPDNEKAPPRHGEALMPSIRGILIRTSHRYRISVRADRGRRQRPGYLVRHSHCSGIRRGRRCCW